MKKILLGIAISVLIASVSYCQETKQSLELTIKSDKEVYGVDEKIIIEYELRNISKDNILMNKRIEAGGNLFFEISGSRGPIVAFIAATWTLPEYIDFLAPHESIKGRYDIPSIRVFKGWRDNPFLAGEHTIKAYLTVYTKSKDGKIEPLIELTSNTIIIEVKEKKDLTKEEAINIAQELIKLEKIDISQHKFCGIDLVEREGLPQSWVVTYCPIKRIRGGRIIIWVNKDTGETHISPDD